MDILINAVGGNHPSATTSADLSFFDLPLDTFRYVGDLDFLGTILPCQVFGQGIAERGECVILHLSSMNALRPLTGIPAYSAVKAAEELLQGVYGFALTDHNYSKPELSDPLKRHGLHLLTPYKSAKRQKNLTHAF